MITASNGSIDMKLRAGDSFRVSDPMTIGLAYRYRGRAIDAYVKIGSLSYRGTARCHPTDRFNKAAGERLAVARAMHKASADILAANRQDIDYICAERARKAAARTEALLAEQELRFANAVAEAWDEHVAGEVAAQNLVANQQLIEETQAAVLASPQRSLWERYGFGRLTR